MSPRSLKYTPEEFGSSNDPLRTLQRRFVAGMFAVGLLALLNQVVLQPSLIQLTSDAPTINVAGRQRMLSQKLSKAALKLTDQTRSNDDEARAELQTALADWTAAHRGLQMGDRELQLPSNENTVIASVFVELEPHFAMMQQAATALTASDLDESTRQELVQVILAEEARYLPKMHQIVGLFEAESRERVRALRIAGWAIVGAILLLLVSLSRFAIHPVMQLIETRVAERTAQLQHMNRQLEREIADRELAERRTRELLDQLAHSSRLNSLGQMASSLAHELNQPLGAIVNFTGAAQTNLKRTPPPMNEVEGILEKISSAGLRAGAIVHRLRSFIRKDEDTREVVALPDLIREVIELCEPEARKQNVRIVFDAITEDVGPLTVTADAIQIQQVLVNLIQNAMHAMQDEPIEKRQVQIALARQFDDDELRIDVIDQGCGFDEDLKEELFTPFYTTRSEGLGMGLAICRSIVQDHQGRFWANSEPSGGAVFSLTLPVVSQHVRADCLPC
ncbi:ATP-binding protein [Thalassoroseus pseudoceratinae]|uniref:ATP-binding protein n=1 Tax=Thalassoroseus pseudoceratinae TaxID=2713176 RepID=UPI0014238576|nr:ATP-binding protein [Thalassoroseus pseudoceratinae]